MWKSCANKQLHCPINVIFQSDVRIELMHSHRPHSEQVDR